MYVAVLYLVFMEAMVSWLINSENVSYVWNPCFLLYFTLLWAKVRMGHVLKPVPIPIGCSVLFLSDFRDFSDFGYNFKILPNGC